MLALIKHEIESIILYLLLPLIVTAGLIIALVSSVALGAGRYPPVGIPRIMFSVFWFPMVFLPFIAAGVGAVQMYSDRSKKISTFLCTLATSRWRILAARIIAGVWSFLIVLIGLGLTDLILLRMYPRFVPVDVSHPVRMFGAALLLNLACYALGLQMGWNERKFFPILGSMALCAPLIFLIVIKGLGVEAYLLLALVAVASLARTWQKFAACAL